MGLPPVPPPDRDQDQRQRSPFSPPALPFGSLMELQLWLVIQYRGGYRSASVRMTMFRIPWLTAARFQTALASRFGTDGKANLKTFLSYFPHTVRAQKSNRQVLYFIAMEIFAEGNA